MQETFLKSSLRKSAFKVKLQWTASSFPTFQKKNAEKGEKFAQHDVMSTIYDLVLKLHNQLQLQVTGENGVTARVVQMTCPY